MLVSPTSQEELAACAAAIGQTAQEISQLDEDNVLISKTQAWEIAALLTKAGKTFSDMRHDAERKEKFGLAARYSGFEAQCVTLSGKLTELIS
jgi:hypothetical protein